MVRKADRSKVSEQPAAVKPPRRSREETQALRAARTQQRQQARAAAAPAPSIAPAVLPDTLEAQTPESFDARAYGQLAPLPPLVLERVARHAGPQGSRGLMQASRSLHEALAHIAETFRPELLAAVLKDPHRLSEALKYPAFRRLLAELDTLHTPQGLTAAELQRVLNACPKLQRLTIESVEPEGIDRPKLRLPKSLRHLSLPAEGEYLFHQHIGTRHLDSLEWRGDAYHGEAVSYGLIEARTDFARLSPSQTKHVRLPHAISAFRAAVREGDMDIVGFYLDRHLDVGAFTGLHDGILRDAELAGGLPLVSLLHERGITAPRDDV